MMINDLAMTFFSKMTATFVCNCKVRNEIKTKRNRIKRNEIKRYETKLNETKTKSNETIFFFFYLNLNFSVFQITKTRQDGGHPGFLMNKKDFFCSPKRN